MIKNEHFYMIERINLSYPWVTAAHLASAWKNHTFVFLWLCFLQADLSIIESTSFLVLFVCLGLMVIRNFIILPPELHLRSHLKGHNFHF